MRGIIRGGALAAWLAVAATLPAAQTIRVETVEGEQFAGIVDGIAGDALQLTTVGTNAVPRTLPFLDLNRLSIGDAVEAPPTVASNLLAIANGRLLGANKATVKLRAGLHRYVVACWQGEGEPTLTFKMAKQGADLQPVDSYEGLLQYAKDDVAVVPSTGFDDEGFRVPEQPESFAKGCLMRGFKVEEGKEIKSAADFPTGRYNYSGTGGKFENYFGVAARRGLEAYDFLFFGFLQIKEDGVYNFELTSTCNSQLYFGGVPDAQPIPGQPAKAAAPASPDAPPPFAVVHDTFADRKPTRTGPLELDWVIAQNLDKLAIVNLKNLDDEKPATCLRVNANGSYATLAGVMGPLEGVALGKDKGDKLELSVQFNWLGPITPESQIRLGLHNNGGHPGETGNIETWGAHKGYAVRLMAKGDKPYLFKETGGHGSVAGGSDMFGLTTQVEIPNKQFLVPEVQKVVFTLTRLENGGVAAAFSLNGTTLIAGFDNPDSQQPEDPTGVYDVFHEVSLGLGPQKDASLALGPVTLKAIPAGSDSGPAPSAPPPGEGALWTADLREAGSLTGRVESWTADTLVLRVLSDAEAPAISVPVAALNSLRLATKAAAKLDLSVKGAEGDAVFVKLADDNIQRVSGEVLGQEEQSLLFRYKGQDRKIGLDKVVGIHFDRTRPADADAFHLALDLRNKSTLPGTWTGLSDEALTWKTAWGQEVTIPWTEARSIRAVNGRLQYLSELQPVDVKQVPFFDRLIPWRADQSLNGGGLKLTKAQDTPYTHGLSMPSKTELTYELDGKFQVFKSTVGFQFPEGANGNIDLRILGDRKPLLEAPGLKGGDTRDLEVDVSGVRELTLVVDFGEGQDVGDQFVFADAKLVRAK